MPYIVPSPSSSSTSGPSSPPHSPSRPPIKFSTAFASPAPVPPQTPFTPPTIPASPTLTSSFASNSKPRSSTVGGTRYASSSSQPPPFTKALSDSNTPTTASLTKSAGVSTVSSPSLSPPIRRTASASSASPTSSVCRYANAAGSSLPRVPRRRGGFTASLSDAKTNEDPVKADGTPPRGRSRSRFVLGAEEESGSGSEEGRKRGNARRAQMSGKEAIEGNKDRTDLKRSVDTDNLPSGKSASHRSPSEALTSLVDSSRTGESGFNELESGSECETPTQSRISGAHHDRNDGSYLQAAAEVQNPASSVESAALMPGIGPRARKGRGRGTARRLMFRDELDDEARDDRLLPAVLLSGERRDGERRDETSTIAFPSRNSPSPPPLIAVAGPTPDVTPFSSPQQDTDLKSFSGKRSSAGSLRLDFSFGGQPKEPRDDHARDQSFDEGRSLSESASLNDMPVIRKKSGEIVRSSLKSRSSSANSVRQRPSLSLGDISSFAMPSPSLSAPTTPASGKMVHFDAHLEHVKVFKSSSKPAAVSRSGSPTYDDTTSGGEGESASERDSLTSFIPRPRPRRLVPGGTDNEEEEAVRRVLMMRILNMPPRTTDMDDIDVQLEGLHLADDAGSVQGIVRVRNIAFEKNVVVRFTFDGWRTTSEVLARWLESCVPRNLTPSPSKPRPRAVSSPVGGMKSDDPPLPTFDRFSFSIRLADMLLRIDEKTLVLAVRYCSAGREMWDNNNGQNYRAIFERRPQHSLTLAGSAVVPSAGTDGGFENSKGEEVTRKGTSKTASGSATSSTGKMNSLSLNLHGAMAGSNMKLKDDDIPSPSKKTSELSARYDLDSCLKNPAAWRPTFEHLHTWAGHGQGRESLNTRAPMPWSREDVPSHETSGKSAMIPIGDLSKFRPFESHSLSFGTRAYTRGSPRDLDPDTLDGCDVERYSRARFAVADDVDASDGNRLLQYHHDANSFASPPSSWISTGMDPHVRNHHRSYFDAWASTAGSPPGFGATNVRRTPPGTPREVSIHRTLPDPEADALPPITSPRLVTPSSEHTPTSSPGRFYSFPPLMPLGNGVGTSGLGLSISRPWANISNRIGRDADDSQASTPSITSVSSATTTSSPSSPPDFSVLTPKVNIGSVAFPDNASMESNSYHAFVNSFCFYRGSDNKLGAPTSEMRRAHSASEVEELLSTPPTSTETLPSLKGSRSSTPTISASSDRCSPSELTPPPTSSGLLESETGMSTRVNV